MSDFSSVRLVENPASGHVCILLQSIRNMMWRCGGSLVALQTTEAVISGSNPAFLTVENSENRQSHCMGERHFSEGFFVCFLMAKALFPYTQLQLIYESCFYCLFPSNLFYYLSRLSALLENLQFKFFCFVIVLAISFIICLGCTAQHCQQIFITFYFYCPSNLFYYLSRLSALLDNF